MWSRPLSSARRSPRVAEQDLLFSGIGELAQMLRARKVSAVELAQLALQRLKRVGSALNAVAELTEELALSHAKLADQRIAGGQAVGPLVGIPWGAKDLLATKNIPTRWGSPAHADQVFEY